MYTTLCEIVHLLADVGGLLCSLIGSPEECSTAEATESPATNKFYINGKGQLH